jgi:hypothetical protein
MKKRAILFVLVGALLAASLFAERGDPPSQPQEKKGPPTFVEEPIPEGKAIVYVYSHMPFLGQKGWANILVFLRSGPPMVLPTDRYISIIADPGPLDLWLVLGAGGQYGSGILAKKFVIGAAGGQATFITLAFGPDLKVVPAEKALKDDGILYCQKGE